MLKNLVAPLSMLVLGLRLSDIDVKGIFKDKYMYSCLLMRHFLLPTVLVLIIKLIGLLVPISYVVASVVVILASAPVATSATMFAEKYDCDAPYVSRIVTISTILSIFTMPLIMLLV